MTRAAETVRGPEGGRDAPRLRVLSFTTLYPNPGKPLHGLFVKNRVEHLAAHADVEVVAPVNVSRSLPFVGAVPAQVELNGLTVHHPPFRVIPGLLKHLDGDLLFRQAWSRMRGRLDLSGFDVLDAHYAYPDGYACMRLAREIGKPYVLSLRGSDIRVLPGLPGRREPIAQALREAAAVVGVSEDLGRLAVELGADPARVHVIPNGVDRGNFHPRPRAEARERLGWAADARVLLAVGRLVPVKGYDLLLRALSVLRRRIDVALQCFIVGEGEERGNLERLVAELDLGDIVKLPGWVVPADLPDWYNGADLFCLTSHSEGCPNVALEAMACGTPVAGTAVGGIPEVIDEGRNGVLIPDREPETAASCLGEALEARWDRDGIAGNPPVRGWEEVAEAQYDVLREAAGF